MSRRLIAAASSDRALGEAQAAGAQPHLLDRLLAGDIEHALPGTRRARRRPAAAGSICRSRDRRRAAPPRRAPGRRRARGRARQCRWRRAAAARPRRPAPRSPAAGRRPPSPREAGAGLRRFLAMVFHSPQVSQRPTHFGGDARRRLADEAGSGLGHARQPRLSVSTCRAMMRLLHLAGAFVDAQRADLAIELLDLHADA